MRERRPGRPVCEVCRAGNLSADVVDLAPVIGDPAGMRALAATLRSAAQSLGNADDAVWSKARSLSFVGPAATRLAAAIGAWHGEIGGAAQQLSDTAGLLERAANEVEAERRARARLRHALTDGPAV